MRAQEAIIYENEAPDVAMCNYRKDNTTIWEEDECMPQNLDWFGIDFYAHDSSVWTGPREAYESMVYPRLSRPDQRVVHATAPVAHDPVGFHRALVAIGASCLLVAYCILVIEIL